MQKQYEQKKVSTALIQGLGGLFFIVLVFYYSFRSYKKRISFVPKVGVYEILGFIQ